MLLNLTVYISIILSYSSRNYAYFQSFILLYFYDILVKILHVFCELSLYLIKVIRFVPAFYIVFILYYSSHLFIAYVLCYSSHFYSQFTVICDVHILHSRYIQTSFLTIMLYGIYVFLVTFINFSAICSTLF